MTQIQQEVSDGVRTAILTLANTMQALTTLMQQEASIAKAAKTDGLKEITEQREALMERYQTQRLALREAGVKMATLPDDLRETLLKASQALEDVAQQDVTALGAAKKTAQKVVDIILDQAKEQTKSYRAPGYGDMVDNRINKPNPAVSIRFNETI